MVQPLLSARRDLCLPALVRLCLWEAAVPALGCQRIGRHDTCTARAAARCVQVTYKEPTPPGAPLLLKSQVGTAGVGTRLGVGTVRLAPACTGCWVPHCCGAPQQPSMRRPVKQKGPGAALS